MSQRAPISEELSARVQFASDRVCCVCRDRSRIKIQLHHIDEDSSNSTFENLAVVCLDCHSETRTKHAFGRNLTPELVRRYNENWREIVSGFQGNGKSPGGLLEYTREVMLELSLACHAFKMFFFVLHPDGFGTPSPDNVGKSVWEVMGSRQLDYSEDNWHKYYPLFQRGIPETIDRIERTCILHAEVISPRQKIEVIRSSRVLNAQRTTYQALPQLAAHGVDPNLSFRPIFLEAFRVFGHLDKFFRNEQKPNQE